MSDEDDDSDDESVILVDFEDTLKNLYGDEKYQDKPRITSDNPRYTPIIIDDDDEEHDAMVPTPWNNDKTTKHKRCRKGRVINPYTGKCIKRGGPTAIKLGLSPKKCSKPKILNPRSNYCVDRYGKVAKKMKQLPKICPKNMIINPTTNRCILKNGELARSLNL